jgi:hypothetical protein
VRHTSWIRFNKFTKIPSISEFTPRVKAQVLVSVTNNTKRRVWFSHFALVKLRRDNRRGNCFRWRWRERRQIKIFSRITNSEGLLARGPRIPTEITEVRVPKVKNVAPSFTVRASSAPPRPRARRTINSTLRTFRRSCPAPERRHLRNSTEMSSLRTSGAASGANNNSINRGWARKAARRVCLRYLGTITRPSVGQFPFMRGHRGPREN